MSITSISIRNFRSIVLLNESVQDINIFVGQNDEGKSNILRALDLFFNHDKNDGYDFDWTRDYCCFAPKLVRKAKEIEIGVVINPPPSFANHKPVIWKKTWRDYGLHHEKLVHEDQTEITPRSKIAAFLKAMRFDYVPAIKGKDYFQALMSKLHDMLEVTVAEQVHEASKTFTNTINQNTQPILKEIFDRLELETTIQLPTNLRSLFAQLEFTSISADKPFSLNQRGDGIKVRHIPIVLRWLADQSNHLSAKGRPKAVTVWGYEEPENNLELRRCFDLAKEFVDGSSEIQAFVTTHSPAFYSVFRECDQSKVGLFLVAKDAAVPTTKVCRVTADHEITSLDSSMGLLELLEPHFKQARHEIDTLRTTVTKLNELAKPALLVEGPTDATIIETAWSKLNPSTPMPYIPIGCGAENGAGGAKNLSSALRNLTAVFDKKVIAIFDNDREGAAQFDGLKSPDFLSDIDNKHKHHKTKDVHAILLPTPTGRDAFVPSKSVHRVLEIEHFFSDALLSAHGMKGNPIYDGTPVFEIKGDKTAFATLSSTFPDHEFTAFTELFSRLSSIL